MTIMAGRAPKPTRCPYPALANTVRSRSVSSCCKSMMPASSAMCWPYLLVAYAFDVDGLTPEVVVLAVGHAKDGLSPRGREGLVGERDYREVLHDARVRPVVDLCPRGRVALALTGKDEVVYGLVLEVVRAAWRHRAGQEEVAEEQVGVGGAPNGGDGHVEVERVPPVERRSRLHTLE